MASAKIAFAFISCRTSLTRFRCAISNTKTLSLNTENGGPSNGPEIRTGDSVIMLQPRCRIHRRPGVWPRVGLALDTSLAVGRTDGLDTHMNPWLETSGVLLLGIVGVALGCWFSRLPKPYWTLGYFIPLSLI